MPTSFGRILGLPNCWYVCDGVGLCGRDPSGLAHPVRKRLHPLTPWVRCRCGRADVMGVSVLDQAADRYGRDVAGFREGQGQGEADVDQ